MTFWQQKSLHEMTQVEWESLCDGCGRCCLHKLEDSTDGEIYYTRVACQLLDIKQCRCRDYAHRTEKIPDCIQLTADNTAVFSWLPESCAYRLLAEGKPLFDWHPLISGDANSVKKAGISVDKVAKAYQAHYTLEDEIIALAKPADE
ncbi:MAG TPA: YcgN family cysteine cluster protein [Gammaproteobacteria bacterium]|nr:YcgN family cysteine cluster protein [Gammaproteobacteria bacterium]